MPRLPENVYLTGPKPHTELPDIMQRASVGLVPFDITRGKDLLRGIRPLKLLEYMAAGQPVVCADWEEVRRMESPAHLYRNKQELVSTLQLTLGGHDPNPSVKFAADHTWGASYRLLCKTLQP